MAFETTKDVIDHARDFHRQVSEFYDRLSVNTQKQRVKMLLEYMSRHESRLEKGLAEYEHEVSQKILNTWFQYPPPKDTIAIGIDLSIEGKEDLSVDEVIELALKIDDCLVGLYKSMVECSEFDEVKEVFNNLLEMEKHEETKFVKDALRLKEL